LVEVGVALVVEEDVNDVEAVGVVGAAIVAVAMPMRARMENFMLVEEHGV
jgi:hypothetical protein